MKRNMLLGWLVGTALVAVLFLLWFGPIIQSDVYHAFANDDELLHVPHGANVWSNLGFVFVGIAGLWKLIRPNRLRLNGPSIMLFCLFAGILLTGIGSAHYHFHPNNVTLFWDRLPMTVVFTSLFSVVGYRYVDKTRFQRMFPLILLSGIASVLWWQYGGYAAGLGDLRPYVLVQYFPMLAIPMILVLTRAEQTRELWWAFCIYILAKVCELADEEIAQFLETGGHTFKHLLASFSTLWLYWWTQRAIDQSSASVED